MAADKLEGGVENMGPQMKGTVTTLYERYWVITDEADKTHMFYPAMLKSIGTYTKDGKGVTALLADFAGYPEGTKVTFNLTDTQGGLEMCNVALDTSEEVGTLIPETADKAMKTF